MLLLELLLQLTNQCGDVIALQLGKKDQNLLPQRLQKVDESR